MAQGAEQRVIQGSCDKDSSQSKKPSAPQLTDTESEIEHITNNLIACEVVERINAHQRAIFQNIGEAYNVVTGAQDYQTLIVQSKNEVCWESKSTALSIVS